MVCFPAVRADVYSARVGFRTCRSCGYRSPGAPGARRARFCFRSALRTCRSFGCRSPGVPGARRARFCFRSAPRTCRPFGCRSPGAFSHRFLPASYHFPLNHSSVLRLCLLRSHCSASCRTGAFSRFFRHANYPALYRCFSHFHSRFRLPAEPFPLRPVPLFLRPLPPLMRAHCSGSYLPSHSPEGVDSYSCVPPEQRASHRDSLPAAFDASAPASHSDSNSPPVRRMLRSCHRFPDAPDDLRAENRRSLYFRRPYPGAPDDLRAQNRRSLYFRRPYPGAPDDLRAQNRRSLYFRRPYPGAPDARRVQSRRSCRPAGRSRPCFRRCCLRYR